MLKVKQFSFNPFGVNTYVIWDEATRLAMVVDPGMTDASERELFDKYITDNGLVIRHIVNTHMHLDHVFGNNYVRDKYGVKIAANPADAALGSSVDGQAAMFGIRVPETFNTEADIALREGDVLTLGDYTFKVIEVPGHSPGGIALYCPEGEFAVVGDSIFAGSIGRTDLPGGDHAALINALRTKILSLPDNTRLLTGHDMSTTVAREKTNPYIV